MEHIVLLGDSIFDNGPYVERGGTTLDELRKRLPTGWLATLLALDDSVTKDFAEQLRRIPKSTTQLVISSGGNDALGILPLLYEEVGNAGEAFLRLGSEVLKFEEHYGALLKAAVETRFPTIVCTVYNGTFDDPQEAHSALPFSRVAH